MDREEIYKKLAARRLAPTNPPMVVPLRRVGGSDQLHHPPTPKKSAKVFFLIGGIGVVLVAALITLWIYPFPPPEQEVKDAARSSFDTYVASSAFGAKTAFVSLDFQPTVRGKKTFLYVVKGQVQLTETIYNPASSSTTTLYALMAQRLAQVSREGLPASEAATLPATVPVLPAIYETSNYKGETAEFQFQIQGTKSDGKWIFFDVPRSFACRRFKGNSRAELPADSVVLGTSEGEAAIARYLKAGNAYLIAYTNAKRLLAGNAPVEAEHKPVVLPVPPIEGATFTGQISHRGEAATSFRAVVGKFDPALGVMPIVFTAEGTSLTTTCEIRPVRTAADGTIEATLVNKGTSGAIYGSSAARGVSRFFVRGTGASFELSIGSETIRISTLSAWTLSLTKTAPEEDAKGTDKRVAEATPRRTIPVTTGLPAITITFPKEKNVNLRMSAEAAEKTSDDGRSNRAAPVTENLMPFSGGLN